MKKTHQGDIKRQLKNIGFVQVKPNVFQNLGNLIILGKSEFSCKESQATKKAIKRLIAIGYRFVGSYCYPI